LDVASPQRRKIGGGESMGKEEWIGVQAKGECVRLRSAETKSAIVRGFGMPE
jgi:hypothetical protein